MSSLISAVSWVKRGVAAQNPSKYVLDDKELERVSALSRIQLEDARIELERAHEAAKSMGLGAEGEEADDAGEDNEDDWVDEDDDENAMDVDSDAKSKPRNPDDLSEYNLDDYDNDVKTAADGPFSNIKGLTYYRDNEEDPYITLKEDDADDEREELEVLPTDNLLVVAKTEDEISQLEIYVYDESQENLYVHHDLMLPNFPLCLEWLDFPPTAPSLSSNPPPQPTSGFGNYIAVGTLDPEIEIWSVDVLEAMYPASILGRPDETKAHIPTPLGTGKKKRKKTKHRAASTGHHVDAVLALSWNKTQRNLLASGSADRTVKLWDLSRDPSINDDGGGAIRSFDVHKDKVQAVRWNDHNPSVLLTGSYDRTVRTFDSRSPDGGVGAVVGSDVEAIRWDPHEESGFYVSLENGLVLNFDARTLPSDLNQPSPAKFTLSAHDGAASALDVNPHIRGCIVTGGNDKLVKVWNVLDDDNGGKRNVSLVTSRDLGVGKVFSAVFSPDDPLTIAAAGSKAKLQIWDVAANFGARKAFAAKLREAGRTLREKEEGKDNTGGVVGVASDDEESDGDEDDE
ncbi:WD40-repeat-containing domain protein [Favolaschia claudopus]|uniref:WD40-repeat-containing domain protein n=1 Tax=Favolaschia claudopus TaxID=2862362 RepID=A0AAW0BYM8_9AGAR